MQNCLFFTTSKLNRILVKWAEEEFSPTGLAPSSAFAVMVLNDRPGMNMGELAEILHLDPSTMTRFIASLEQKGLVERIRNGRFSKIATTKAGQSMHANLSAGWARVWKRYTDILGIEVGNGLAGRLHAAALNLEKKV